MTTTTFYNPTTITQVSVPNEITGIPSIDWNFDSNMIADGAEAVTKTGLYTIPGVWMEKFLSNTSQLWCTKFLIPYTQVGYRATFTQDIYGNTTTGVTGNNSTYIELESHSVMTSLFDTSTYYGNRYYTLYNPITVTYADGQQQTVTYVRCTNATSNGVIIGLESTAGHNFPITIQTSNYDQSHPLTISGIELQLNIQRAARIEDLLIQLTLNGQLIGNNYASTVNPVQSDMYTGDYTTPLDPVGDSHIYGSNIDLWGTTGLTPANVTNSTFGVVVSFKSNVIYPHRDLAYLSQVALRITYG